MLAFDRVVLMIACTIAAFSFATNLASAADDKASLAGLREVKVAFDLKDGDGKALLSRLNIIDETRQSLIQQGVSPHFVVAYRGGATRLVQTDTANIKMEDRPLAERIAQKIRDMSAAPGVDRFEQCAVAVREQGTNPDKVLPQVQVVGNGFISLMAYQSKGYAYIAP